MSAWHDSVRIDVAVDAHGTHGSLATVSLAGLPTEQRAELEAAIDERLGPFTLQHTIERA